LYYVAISNKRVRFRQKRRNMSFFQQNARVYSGIPVQGFMGYVRFYMPVFFFVVQSM